MVKFAFADKCRRAFASIVSHSSKRRSSSTPVRVKSQCDQGENFPDALKSAHDEYVRKAAEEASQEFLRKATEKETIPVRKIEAQQDHKPADANQTRQVAQERSGKVRGIRRSRSQAVERTTQNKKTWNKGDVLDAALVPDSFQCPILQEVMRDPVTLGSTGHTFERAAIAKWLETHSTDPLTNMPLKGDTALTPNLALRSAIEDMLVRSGGRDAVADEPVAKQCRIDEQCIMAGVRRIAALHRSPYKTSATVPRVDMHTFLQKQLAYSGTNRTRFTNLHKSSSEHAAVRHAMAEFFGTQRIMCIKSVTKVENRALAKRFQDHKTLDGKGEIVFKVHGTQASASNDILEKGFRLPTDTDESGNFLAGTLSRQAHDYEYLKLGGGLYFTSHGTKADAFGGEDSVMLLCAVRLGRVWQRSDDDPKLNQGKVRAAGYDSVYCPGSSEGGLTQLDEYVVYNPDAVYPMYAVRYRTVRVRTAEFVLAQIREGCQACTTTSSRSPFNPIEAEKKVLQVPEIENETDVIDDLVKIGDICRDQPRQADFLEKQHVLTSLLRRLQGSCEVTQWQTLRVVANFIYCSDKRQALLHCPSLAQSLFPTLCDLLASENGAVVQKAAFVACNLRANHSPPVSFQYNIRLLDALVQAIRNADEDLTVLYAAAALSNLVVTRSAAITASHVMPRILECFNVAERHETWIKWAVDLCRNFVRAGWEGASAMLQVEGIGGMLASLVENKDSAILRSRETTASVANCIAAATLASDRIAADLVRCRCAFSLISLLEKQRGTDTEFYIAQSIRALCQSSAGLHVLREPSIVTSIVRRFKSDNCKASIRHQLALTLSRLDNEQLAQRGLRRAALQHAIDGFKVVPLGPAKTSLADGS